MEFLRITIDFDQSHLFFPRIVGWVLAGLFAVALAVRRREIACALGGLRAACGAARASFDFARFGGTVVLLVAYIVAMDRLSDVWPNTGLSFLVCSIAFMAALSCLYLRERPPRKLAVAALLAAGAPLVVWYALAKLFFLTLP
jgi:hypothetical protein